MKKEKSAGALVFRTEKGKPLYLLLRYPSGAKARKPYWDLPKGHMEKGEREHDTVKREVKEETGLEDIAILKGFRVPIHYFFEYEGQRVFKTVVFYLAQTREKKVRISPEHLGFAWLPYEKAKDQLTYENAKQVLQKAHHFVRTKGV